MSFLLFAAVASGAAAILLLLGALVPHGRRRHVVSLNLGAATMSNAIVGTPKKFVITPKDQFGLAVDLAKFPAALTGIAWSVANADLATVSPAADGLSCDVTFSVEGATTVVVKALDKDGTELSEQVDVTAELPVPKVTSLNLSEA